MDHDNDHVYQDDGKRKKRKTVNSVNVKTPAYEHKQTRAIKNENERCVTTVASFIVPFINLLLTLDLKFA